MGNRITNHVQGFAVVDSRWKASNLRTNDAASGNSDYTEASPQPGQMELEADGNQGRLEISGGQATTFYGKAALGGDAAFNSSGIAYRIEGETDDKDWRGWNPPNFPQYWSYLQNTAGGGYGICVNRRTQKVWAVTAISSARYLYQADGTGGWTGGLDAVLTDTTGVFGIAEHNGTLYFVVRGLGGGLETLTASESDYVFSLAFQQPSGATIGGAPDRADLAIDDRGQMLFVIRSSDNNLYQFASQNFGATWSYIGAFAGQNTLGQVVAIPGGGFMVSSVGILAGVRILPDAFTPLDDVDTLTPHGSHVPTDGAFAAWAD